MDVLQELEREVAVFARRMESARQTGQGTSQLDRSAYLILLTLQAQGDMTIGELANVFHHDISTVSRQIAPLVAAGWIARTRDEDDKRRVVIRSTQEGENMLFEVRDARRVLYADLLADWSDSELSIFLHLLQRLNRRIDQRQSERYAQTVERENRERYAQTVERENRE